MLKFEAFVAPPEPDEAHGFEETEGPQRVRGVMFSCPMLDVLDAYHHLATEQDAEGAEARPARGESR
jgi:hypothetical protein